MGGNPLYADANDTTPGTFEKRIEIYSPPYLYADNRPEITSGPEVVRHGGTARFGTSDPSAIKAARLMRPSAVTHVTDVEQRSIALRFTRTNDGIRASIPRSVGLVPSGWYMLFVDNGQGTPSEARWVQVGGASSSAGSSRRGDTSESAKPAIHRMSTDERAGDGTGGGFRRLGAEHDALRAGRRGRRCHLDRQGRGVRLRLLEAGPDVQRRNPRAGPASLQRDPKAGCPCAARNDHRDRPRGPPGEDRRGLPRVRLPRRRARRRLRLRRHPRPGRGR